MALHSAMGFFFQYLPGFAKGPGVGTEGLGLAKPQTDPLYAPYDRRHTVRGDLVPTGEGINKLIQDFQPVNIRGNGIYLQGQMDLQALAQFQSNGGK